MNFVITLLFGWSGLHKFMQRKYGAGFLYLFTFGVFGIGWIIDVLKCFSKPVTQNLSAAITPLYLSDEYIDSLMASHTSYRDCMQPVERDFTRALLNALAASHVKLPLCYDIKGSCINYRLSAYQLGRIILCDDHKQIQILKKDTVKWIDISGIDDALLYIPQWISYALYLDSHNMQY